MLSKHQNGCAMLTIVDGHLVYIELKNHTDKNSKDDAVYTVSSLLLLEE